MKKLVFGLIWLLFLLPLFFCAVWFRKEISAGVSFGVNYSLGVLIPSLFPMIFLSCLLSLSPAAILLAKWLSSLTRLLFGLPGAAALPVLLGLTCGYPVGARLTANLLQQGSLTKQQAQRLMLFVVNPGIPFSVLFVGGVVLQSTSLGFLLFLCTSLASLLTGILLNCLCPLDKCVEPPAPKKALHFMPAMDAAARSTLSATCTMCLYVVLFSAFLPLLRTTGIFQWVVRALPANDQRETAALLTFFTDVIHGVNHAATLKVAPHIFALGLSFGGLCIHAQLFSFFKSPCLSIAKFYGGRLLCCTLSCGLFFLLAGFFCLPPSGDIAVFSSMSSFTPAPHKGTLTGSLCLLLLSAAFIYLNTGVEKKQKL